MSSVFDGTYIDNIAASSLMERYIEDRMEKNYKYSVLNPQIYDLILMDEMMRIINKPYLLVDPEKGQTATEAYLTQTLDFNDSRLTLSLFNYWSANAREYIEHVVEHVSPVHIEKNIDCLSENEKQHLTKHLELHKRTMDLICTRLTDTFMTKVFGNEFVIDNLIQVTDDSHSSTIYSIVKKLFFAVNDDIFRVYRAQMPTILYYNSLLVREALYEKTVL